MNISAAISKIKSSIDVIACFETLCGVHKVTDLITKLPSLCSTDDDAKFVDGVCDWSLAKHWAKWWARSDHLKMLSTAFSVMDEEVWSKCPATTNADMERKKKIANLTIQTV